MVSMAEENNSLINYIFILFGILLIFSIAGYFLLIFANYIPVAPGGFNIITYLTQTTYNYVDASLYFVFLFALFCDLLISYFRPSIWRGIANIFGIFILAYLNLVALNFVPLFLLPFNANSVLPITYSLFMSTYRVVVLYFLMIISIILDFRGRRK